MPIGTTYSEYVHYQTQNDETYIGVIEFLENVTLDSSGAVEANELYPGFVTAENGTVRYFGKVNDKALLVVNTTNIEMAAYLIKNLEEK